MRKRDIWSSDICSVPLPLSLQRPFKKFKYETPGMAADIALREFYHRRLRYKVMG